MNKPKCKTCDYYEPIEDEGKGFCKEDSPDNLGQSKSTVSRWPTVPEGEWCGKHSKLK